MKKSLVFLIFTGALGLMLYPQYQSLRYNRLFKNWTLQSTQAILIHKNNHTLKLDHKYGKWTVEGYPISTQKLARALKKVASLQNTNPIISSELKKNPKESPTTVHLIGKKRELSFEIGQVGPTWQSNFVRIMSKNISKQTESIVVNTPFRYLFPHQAQEWKEHRLFQNLDPDIDQIVLEHYNQAKTFQKTIRENKPVWTNTSSDNTNKTDTNTIESILNSLRYLVAINSQFGPYPPSPDLKIQLINTRKNIATYLVIDTLSHKITKGIPKNDLRPYPEQTLWYNMPKFVYKEISDKMGKL